MRYWLVMPAAGSGRRFRERDPAPPSARARELLPKQYAPLLGRTVIEWALAPFVSDARCAAVVVALAPDDRHWQQIAARAGGAKRSPGALGPRNRQRLGARARCGAAVSLPRRPRPSSRGGRRPPGR